MTHSRLSILILILSAQCLSLQAQEIILVNKPLSDNDKRYEYPEILLDKILELTSKEFGEAQIQHTKYPMKRDRTLLNLIEGEKIHVMAEAPKPNWESDLLPIRIPIRKGIQGFRIFLILKKNQTLLSKIDTLEDLKKIPTGSGKQWSTTRVLQHNDFNVVTGTNYEGLFGMLTKERFITFGRGINEADMEYEQRKKQYPELAIEQDLLLYIPLPTYFFVTPKKPQLARRIEKGLNIMINSGLFDDIFNEHFGQMIEKARLNKRKVFKISNPNLSSLTPLASSKYWYPL